MDCEKLVISGMRHFESLLDSDGSLLAGKSTIMLRSQGQLSIKTVLGILNSALVAFYIREAYGVLGIDGGINFTKGLVESLPVARLGESETRKINPLVDEILSIVGEGGLENRAMQTKFAEIDKKIDHVVYRLYGLNAKEIAIIEDTLK